MPLTPFQSEVLAIVSRNRSEASHFAGGLVLNAAKDSARYSHDFDIFHTAAAEVVAASELDAASLRAAGYEVNPASPWEGPGTFPKWSGWPTLTPICRSASRFLMTPATPAG